MKALTTALFLLPAMASAQNFQNMNEADMQKMMASMQQAQSCMQDIDQSKMKEFEQHARQMEAKVDGLCAAGKRDKAQSEAMAFYKEMSANPDIKKMRKCSKMMEGAMPDLSAMTGMPSSPAGIDKPGKDEHICDN